MNNKLFLEKGQGHTLWAHEDELADYIEQLQTFPKGNCLEIGLGLGIASRYILSFPAVKSLTTVEIDEDVIKAQNRANLIEDNRHLVLNANGLLYAYQTKKKYDFIFLDFYSHIDEETIPSIADMANACKRLLASKGKMMGWVDPATSGDDYKTFERIFEGV